MLELSTSLTLKIYRNKNKTKPLWSSVHFVYRLWRTWLYLYRSFFYQLQKLCFIYKLVLYWGLLKAIFSPSMTVLNNICMTVDSNDDTQNQTTFVKFVFWIKDAYVTYFKIIKVVPDMYKIILPTNIYYHFKGRNILLCNNNNRNNITI